MNTNQAARQSSRIPVKALLPCACVLVILDAYVLTKDAVYRTSMYDRLAQMQVGTATLPIGDLTADDPQLGFALPKFGAGLEIRRTERPSIAGFLVVALSDCTGCTRFDTVRWTGDASRANIRLLAISGSSKEDIASFRSGMPGSLPIYHDANLALHSKLNAAWNGRLYYFDRDWKLRWISSPIESDRHLSGLPQLSRAITTEQGGHAK